MKNLTRKPLQHIARALAIVFFVSVASVPFAASAATTNITADQGGVFQFIPLELGSFPLIGPALSNGTIDFGALVNSGYKLILAILAMITVGSIVFFGIQYMVTGGIEIKKNALMHATNAFYGLLLLIFAFILLNTINPELVQPGVGLYNMITNPNGTTASQATSNSRVVNINQPTWFYEACTQQDVNGDCTLSGQPTCAGRLGLAEADPTQCAGNPQTNNGKQPLCCSPQ